MKRSVIIALMLLLLSSCGIKTKLSKEDLQWIDYHVGQRLVFTNDKGGFDTIEVTERRIYYPAYNPIELHDKYLPQMAEVTAKRPNEEEFKLIGLSKRKPNKSASWGLQVYPKYFGFFPCGEFRCCIIDTIPYAQLKLNISFFGENTVLRLSEKPNALKSLEGSLFVKHVYLSLSYKILAYELSSGELWRRVL